MELNLKPIELPGIEKETPDDYRRPMQCRNRRTSNGIQPL